MRRPALVQVGVMFLVGALVSTGSGVLEADQASTLAIDVGTFAEQQHEWDYVYGTNSSNDYSEYSQSFALPDGGVLLVGEFAGSFEGFDAGANYRLFGQRRGPSGAVVWTTDLIPSPIETFDCTTPYETKVEMDGAGVVFIGVSGCWDGLISLSADGNAITLPGSLKFLAASSTSGVYASGNGTDPDTSISRSFVRRYSSDFSELWSTYGLAELVQPGLSAASSPDGDLWLAGYAPRRLAHLQDAIVLFKLSEVDGTATTIKHLGWTCVSGGGYPVVNRVSSESLWLWGCRPSELDWSVPMPTLYFDTTDGSLLGEVGGFTKGTWANGNIHGFPHIPGEIGGDLRACWVNNGVMYEVSDEERPHLECFADGSEVAEYVRFSEGGSLASATLSIQEHHWQADGSYAIVEGEQSLVWQVTGDGPSVEWALIQQVRLTDGAIVSDVSSTEDLIISVGSTTSGAIIEQNATDTPRSGLVERVSDVGAFLEALTTKRAFVTSSPNPLNGDFSPLVPARLLDTRPAEITVDGQHRATGRVSAGGIYKLQVTGRGLVAGDADAVMLNVTAVSPAARGFLTVFPCGSSLPKASNVNYVAGDVVPNAVLAKIGTGGKVCIYTKAATDIVVDVNGYVPAGGSFGTVVPARLLETRSGPNETTVDHLFEGIGRQGAGKTLQLKVTDRGRVPADADAVMLNVTAVSPAARGFLTVFPCGSSLPKASNVNYVAGDVVPNAVLAKIGTGGKVCIYTKAATDIVVDVNGYVPAGGSFGTVVPARLLETRSGPNETTVDHLFEGIGRQGAGKTLQLKVTDRGRVPADADAVMLNVTAVSPAARGFLTVFPCGSSLPKASNVNYVAGDVVPNAVLAKIGTGGKVCIYTSAATDIVVDVNGYVP